MIKVECQFCGAVLSIDEKFLGKYGTCKKCGNKIQAIPAVPKTEDMSAGMFDEILETPKRKAPIVIPPSRMEMSESTKKGLGILILMVVILVTFAIALNSVSTEKGRQAVNARDDQYMRHIQNKINKANPYGGSTKPEAGFSMPGFGKQNVTFAQYSQIQTGMSYEQVVSIIGKQGEEISQNKIDAIPGVMNSITTVMYQWVNGNGSNMNAIFQNNRLLQKAQFGLK